MLLFPRLYIFRINRPHPDNPGKPTITISVVITHISDTISIHVFLVTVCDLRAVVAGITNFVPILISLVSVEYTRAIVLNG